MREREQTKRADSTWAAGSIAAGLVIVCLCGCSGEGRVASPAVVLPARSDVRVVLFMLDGVRRRDLFGRPEPERISAELTRLQTLRREAADRARSQVQATSPEAAPRVPDERTVQQTIQPQRNFFAGLDFDGPGGPLIFGRPHSRALFYSANAVMKSLPAYQSIFTGTAPNCLSNECGAVALETFFARLSRAPGSKRAAAIASWGTIRDALQLESGEAFVNTGPGWFPEFSPAHRLVNGSYQKAESWSGARSDAQTFAHGLVYLREQKPDFLFLSLNDADEWAHLGRYTDYARTLREYDTYIALLRRELSALPGENWLFVTSDHDRGPGRRWTSHGFEIQAASTFLLVFGPLGQGMRPVLSRATAAEPSRTVVRTHLDIRPTIESLLGVPVRACPLCGVPIPEVLERARAQRRKTEVAR